MKSQNNLKFVSVFSVIFLIMQVSFIFFGLYEDIWFADIIMHILGGVWVASVFEYWFYERSNILKKENGFWPNVILCVSFVVFVGVLWEFYEFFFDRILFLHYQQGFVDTMKDLLNDMAGGFLASILYFIKK